MIRFQNVQNKNDIDTVVLLADVTWHEHYKELLSADQINYMLGKYLSYKAIKEHIDNGGIFNIIEYDGMPVGFTAFDIEDKFIFIDKVYILHDFRNRHIGKTTIEHIENYAKELGKSGVYLTVNKYNKNSIKAYKSFGFLCEGSCVTDIGGGYVMDDYRMYKIFKK